MKPAKKPPTIDVDDLVKLTIGNLKKDAKGVLTLPDKVKGALSRVLKGAIPAQDLERALLRFYALSICLEREGNVQAAKALRQCCETTGRVYRDLVADVAVAMAETERQASAVPRPPRRR